MGSEPCEVDFVIVTRIDRNLKAKRTSMDGARKLAIRILEVSIWLGLTARLALVLTLRPIRWPERMAKVAPWPPTATLAYLPQHLWHSGSKWGDGMPKPGTPQSISRPSLIPVKAPRLGCRELNELEYSHFQLFGHLHRPSIRQTAMPRREVEMV